MKILDDNSISNGSFFRSTKNFNQSFYEKFKGGGEVIPVRKT